MALSRRDLDALNRALGNVATASERQVESFNRLSDAMRDNAKATKESESGLKDLRKQLDSTQKDMDEVDERLESSIKVAGKLAKALGFKASVKLKGYDKLNEELRDYRSQLKAAQAEFRALQMSEPSGTAIESAQKRVQALSKSIQNLKKLLNEATDATPTSAIASMGGSIKGIGSAFGALRKSPMEFAEHMKSASLQAKNMKEGTTVLAKMPGLLGAAGKAAKGLAGAFGSVTKLLAGWPGVVAMAVVQVAKAATRIDSYIKGMNKRFAEIRGPEIMTTDLKRQFTDFNRAIINAAANIRDGLVPEQVYEFMSAIGTAGQRLTTLNEGFHSYRDAVNVAAKASKVFGMDMATVGNLMGKLTTNYKMDLESIDDAFVQTAFDAQKSGLSTDRFLTAIQNASVGLSFYGTYLKSASKIMSEFTKTGVLGADDAEQATQDLVQAFAKMDTKEAMALIQISKGGTKAFKDAFSNLRKETAEKAEALGQQAIDVEAELLVAPKEKRNELTKKLDQLRTEQKKQMELSERLQRASMGDQIAMAQNIGSLTNSAPKDMLKLISSITGVADITKLQGNQLEIAMHGVEKVTGGKITQKLVQKLIAQTRANGQDITIALGVAEDNLAAVTGTRKDAKEDSKGLLGYLKKINKTSMKNLKEGKKSSVELEKLVGDLIAPLSGINENSADTLKEDVAGKLSGILGMSEQSAIALVNASATNKEFRDGLINLTKETATGKVAPEKMVKLLNNLVTRTGVMTTYQADAFTATESATKKTVDAYDATFKGIKDQTLSIEEMLNIAKSEIEWRAKTLDLFNTGNGLLYDISTGISKWVGEKFGAYDTKKMIDATNNLKESFKISFLEGRKKVSVAGAAPMETAVYVKKLMTQNANIAQNMNEANDNLTALSNLQRKKKPSKEELQQLENLKKGKDDWERIVAEGSQNLKQNNDILGQLQTAGAADQDMIDLLTAQLAGNKEAEKALLDIARRKFPGMTKVSLEQLKSVKNIGPALVSAAASAGRIKFPEKVKEGEKPLIMAGALKVKGVEVELASEMTKQGLTKPEQVIKGGAVFLHPGETIFPKSASDIKTSIMEPTPVATAAPVEKNISITVNATEKDLAQRIANEVRGVLYRQGVNNLG